MTKGWQMLFITNENSFVLRHFESYTQRTWWKHAMEIISDQSINDMFKGTIKFFFNHNQMHLGKECLYSIMCIDKVLYLA